MSRHLDGSPKPADPLWYRQRETLHARCACGHGAALPLGELARRHRLDRNLRLWRLAERLRCSRCGTRPPGSVDVR